MLVIVSFTYYSDLVYIPDSSNYTPKKLQTLFDKWLYNKEIDHEYWIYRDGRKYGVSFDIHAFIKWLNENIFADSDDKAKIKVRITKKNASQIPKGLEELYF